MAMAPIAITKHILEDSVGPPTTPQGLAVDYHSGKKHPVAW
jgi:hypothetical protein